MTFTATRFLIRHGSKIICRMSNRIVRMSSGESCQPPPPCPDPPPVPEPQPSEPEPPPCPKLPPPCPPPLFAQVPDPGNPCNYTPPTCVDPEYPDLRKLKKKQCHFQENMSRRNRPPQEANIRTNRVALLRPPEKTAAQSFKDFFWDRERKACLTRTPINWLSITLYYIIFVAVVLLIFFLCILLAEKIASRKGEVPQFTLDDSPIGSSPGLNYFPVVNDRNLLWLSKGKSYSDYVDAVNSVFSDYKKNENFDPSKFKDCGVAPFGYANMTPCIFLRLNRLINWKPKPYRQGDTLPEDMPDSVKKEIQSGGSPKIWVSCTGSTAKDRDHLSPDSFVFQDSTGFDPSPYPYERQKNFLDPIVALKLVDSSPEKVLYSISCKAWAKKLDINYCSFDLAYYFE